MSELYVVYFNHMDLSWRRPCYRAGKYDGYTIAPYMEIEELQIEAGLEFIRAGGNYEIEQVQSLRNYLENNPDSYSEIKQMITEGKLHIQGSGEASIDVNLPSGETQVRNQLYACRWLKSEFNLVNKFANCPDVFGLSAGIPMMLKKLGYWGLMGGGRGFDCSKNFWRGISGDTVLTNTPAAMNEIEIFMFMNRDVSCRVCDICHGAGCAACGYNGYFPEYTLETKTDAAQIVKHIRDMQKKTPDGDFIFMIFDEETITSPKTFSLLKEVAEETGLHLHPTTKIKLMGEDFACETDENLINKYLNNTFCQEEVATQFESEPCATGAYTTRIKMKQVLRRCEASLMACERLAVAAQKECNMPYPVKTIEKLWRKLMLFCFHDAVTATCSDDAFDELMEIARQIIVKANRITNKSISAITNKQVGMEKKGNAFVVFNPLEFDVKNVRLEGVVDINEFVSGGRIVHPDGHITEAVAIRHAENPEYKHAIVEFYGDLPAFGYKVFRFLPKEETDKQHKTGNCQEAILENEHLRVIVNDYGIQSVVDKHTDQVIAGSNTFVPIITDDAGHVWGRTSPGFYKENGVCPSFRLSMVPPHNYQRSMEVFTWENGQRAKVNISFSRPDRMLNKLDWEVEYVLPKDSEELFVYIKTSFDARDLRLSTQVTLPSRPKDGKMEYEIPLGKIKRGVADAYIEALGFADDWAAMHYVCAELEDVNVLLCNNGTPSHRLIDNVIQVALLRTPTQTQWAFNMEGAIDTSEHNFAFTLSATPDRNLTPYRRGAALNAEYPIMRGGLEGSEVGRYFQDDLPNNVPLIALKGAEDGKGYIARYLGMEDKDSLKFSNPVWSTSVMEEDEGTAVTEVEIPPYTIQTIRIY